MAKQIVAIDIDEVLAPHNATLAAFHNKTFGTSHTVDEYHDDWDKLWGVEYTEAERRARLWHASDDFTSMKPIDGAIAALRSLKESYDLIVVTGRAKRMAELTETWLNEHFPATFGHVEFVGIYEEGLGKDKAEICVEHGVAYLIDDSLTQVKACSSVGIESILFGNYNWNQLDELPKGVTRCEDWASVLDYFAKLSKLA